MITAPLTQTVQMPSLTVPVMGDNVPVTQASNPVKTIPFVIKVRAYNFL